MSCGISPECGQLETPKGMFQEPEILARESLGLTRLFVGVISGISKPLLPPLCALGNHQT